MKVEKIDMAWSAVSMVILGFSFYHNKLIYGLIAVYALMAVLFFMHIFRIRKKTADSIPVYATITGYTTDKDKIHVAPTVRYELEDGTEMNSVYSVFSRKQLYETGSDHLICYCPDEPLFFYFADRENELVDTYYRFIIIGGIAVTVMFIISQLV